MGEKTDVEAPGGALLTALEYMKTTFITTVFNEEESIEKLLESLFTQTLLPDEIIIVDGGSSDQTVKKIKLFNSSKGKKIEVQVFIKKGNRSIGRNEAIKNATHEIILCSDAGCLLEKNWVKHISEPFGEKKIDVVAGYYKGKPKTIFQKCLIPYVLVMEDKVDPENFLPATRSLAFRKAIWGKIGGFPEQFSHSEDYIFARRLKAIGAKIVFAQDAIVYWIPRNTLREAWYMFYRFALGDAEAGIIRPNVILLYSRYLAGLSLVIFFLLTKVIFFLPMMFLLFFAYLVWSINKHYHYINDPRTILILPMLQMTADTAVLIGTSIGLCKKLLQ